MNREERRAAQRYLEAERARRPAACLVVPRDQWPRSQPGLVEVWRSRDFLVQVFEGDPARMSVCRTEIADNGRWTDGISWDELQRLKREIGRGNTWAVEVYPADADIVCVANMRHLWLLSSPPPFGWRRV